MELWAAIDLMGGSAVTLVQGRPGEKTVWAEDPLLLARRWQDEGADGLHLIDLDAALGTGSNRETALRIIRETGLPVEVGGGVRSVESARAWLGDGAARIILGTLAFSDPTAGRSLVETHGADRVVVAADYRDGMIVTRGWTESQGVSVLAGAKNLEEQGFVNLLTTAVGRDGTSAGPDLATVRELAATTRMKVIASGGIRDALDVEELARAGACGAVLGRALYEGTVRLTDAKRRLT